MENIARLRLLCLIVCSAAISSSPVRADLVDVSIDGSVDVHGNVSIPGGVPSFYSQSQTSAPFSVSGFADTFNPADPTNVVHANSSASQSSNVSALGFSFAQQFYCNWSPGNLFSGGVAGAAAATFFQVTFIVTQAVNYQLALSGGHGGGDSWAYSQNFSLNGTPLLLGGTYSGLLLPGTYVLTASESFFGPSDVLGGGFFCDINGQMQFSGVPESGGFFCLLLGVLSIALIRETAQKKARGLALMNVP